MIAKNQSLIFDGVTLDMRHSRRWKTAQYFEKRWWKRYLKQKPKDQYLTWKKAYWKNFLNDYQDVIPVLDGTRVLDAGCGPAGIFTVLEKSNVTALDPLLHDYDNELDHFNFNDYPAIDFIESKIENLNENGQFETIFCMNAINHVQDIRRALVVLSRCLTPGGSLVITVDAHKYKFLQSMFRFIPGDILHPHQFDQSGYVGLCVEAGLEVQQTVKLQKGNIFDYLMLIAINQK